MPNSSEKLPLKPTKKDKREDKKKLLERETSPKTTKNKSRKEKLTVKNGLKPSEIICQSSPKEADKKTSILKNWKDKSNDHYLNI